MRGLPWWFWLAVGIIKYWFVSIPLAALLAYAAISGTTLPAEVRGVLAALAAVLLVPFPAAAIVVLYQNNAAKNLWRTLDSAATVAGLALPAGARVRFADKEHTLPVEIELPGVCDIRGMQLSGIVSPLRKWGDVENAWGADLASDQDVDGLPCRAGGYRNDRFGGIIFDDRGTIHRCTLAREHKLLGLTLPAGTTVTRGKDTTSWSFLLPPDTGAEIPALETTAPAGCTLDVTQDGILTEIGSGHGQTIVVRGIPLNTINFKLNKGVVLSQLAEPFEVDGNRQPVGTIVTIDLSTGGMTVARE